MKTHFFLMSTVIVLGAAVLTTSYAANTSEYLHFTRHRDSQGNLLMAPTQPQAETSVIQKTMMPSQPKTFERRSTDWGMSAQDVKANEPVQPSWELRTPVLAEYEQRVAYHTNIEGIDAALTYTFYEGHLGQAKYVFEAEHDDAVDYVQDFHTVKKWISRSYGLPTSVQDIWLNTLYQYDQSLWGQAVLRGHLVMAAEWKQPGTDIVLVLDGGEDMIVLVADFASTTFIVPVSFDVGSAKDNVEEGMQKTTIQEVLPAESMDDVNREDDPVQETLIEQTGIEGHPSDTEVASKALTELDEIEAMLNEEFPELEPLEPAQIESSIEGDGHELSHDPQASLPLDELPPDGVDPQAVSLEPTQVNGLLEEQPGELSLDGQKLPHDSQASVPLDELAPDVLDDQALSLEPTHGEGLLEEHSSELSLDGHELSHDPQASLPLDELAPDGVDPQAVSLEPAHEAGLLEESSSELSLDGHELSHDPQASLPMDELALDHQALEQDAPVEGITEEHSMTSAMGEEMHELNLDPQASMDMDEMTQHTMDIMGQESTQEGTMGEHAIEPEHSISNVSEDVVEGLDEMTSEQATQVDSVDDHFNVDRVNESGMESEAELEGHHL